MKPAAVSAPPITLKLFRERFGAIMQIAGDFRQLSCNLANWGILIPFKILITRPYEVILYNIDKMSFSSVLGASFCYKLVKIGIQFYRVPNYRLDFSYALVCNGYES